MKYFYAVIFSLLFLSGCVTKAKPSACVKILVVEVLCGMSAPEDMALLPDKNALIISHYNYSSGPGNISLFELPSSHRVPLYPSSESALKADGWGDDNCLSEPREKLSPHGIDLRVRADGALQLLVVNHGGSSRIGTS